MAEPLSPSQIPTISVYRERRSGNSTKRKRLEGSLELRIRATASGQAIVPKTPINSTKGGKVIKRKLSEKSISREYHTSLRRVDDSTDVLRERSLQESQVKKAAVLDSISGGREGRQFTVANVGNNGMIYLRLVYSSSCNAGGTNAVTTVARTCKVGSSFG